MLVSSHIRRSRRHVSRRPNAPRRRAARPDCPPTITPNTRTQRPRPMRWIESSGIGYRTDCGRSCAPRPAPRQGPNRCPASAGRSGRWRGALLIGCGTVRTAARRFTRLTELASMDPLTTAANHDSRTSTLRLRAEAARAKSAAAGPDSPARNHARQLVAQRGRRDRQSRESAVNPTRPPPGGQDGRFLAYPTGDRRPGPLRGIENDSGQDRAGTVGCTGRTAAPHRPARSGPLALRADQGVGECGAVVILARCRR